MYMCTYVCITIKGERYTHLSDHYGITSTLSIRISEKEKEKRMNPFSSMFPSKDTPPPYVRTHTYIHTHIYIYSHIHTYIYIDNTYIYVFHK